MNRPTSIPGQLKGEKKIEALIKKFQEISRQNQEQLKASVVSEQ